MNGILFKLDWESAMEIADGVSDEYKLISDFPSGKSRWSEIRTVVFDKRGCFPKEILGRRAHLAFAYECPLTEIQELQTPDSVDVYYAIERPSVSYSVIRKDLCDLTSEDGYELGRESP